MLEIFPDVIAESSNGVVSIEATAAPELPLLVENDLVIGRASAKMVLVTAIYIVEHAINCFPT